MKEYWRLLGYLKPYWFRLSLAVFSVVGFSVLDGASMSLSVPLMDDHEDHQGRNPWEMIIFDAGASLSVKVLEWLSLDYHFKVLKNPFIVDDYQIQNHVLLTVGYTFFGPKPPPAEAAPAEGQHGPDSGTPP